MVASSSMERQAELGANAAVRKEWLEVSTSVPRGRESGIRSYARKMGLKQDV